MIDIKHLQDWQGRGETRDDLIAAFPANALAATLDRDDEEYRIGDALPPLWHWLHFLPIHKLGESGYDGHAALGGFLPPVPLPRRMWAGSRLEFLAPVTIGRSARKRSTVKSVTHKSGRSGDLVFVTVTHDVFEDQKHCIREEQDIVYRALPDPNAPIPTPPHAPTSCDFFRKTVPDPVLLFRYSALTFNGHRIHYDHPFCVGAEGYGGLVVHGPLLATLMLDLLRREYPAAKVTHFNFRALAPVFDTQQFSVHGTCANNGEIELWVARKDGAFAMQGTAQIKDKT